MELKHIKRVFRQYFNFSRQERNGITALCILLFILIAVNYFIDKFPNEAKTDFSELKELIAQWESQANENKKSATRLFLFDPNQIPKEKLDSLALPIHVKRNLVRYREKGGVFI